MKIYVKKNRPKVKSEDSIYLVVLDPPDGIDEILFVKVTDVHSDGSFDVISEDNPVLSITVEADDDYFRTRDQAEGFLRISTSKGPHKKWEMITDR